MHADMLIRHVNPAWIIIIKNIDKYDKAILSVLPHQGRVTNQSLAEQAHLSTATCWRRVDKLETQGIIDRYVALVNREKLGLSVMVYIHIKPE